MWSPKATISGCCGLGEALHTVPQAVFFLCEVGNGTSVNVDERLKANGHRGNAPCRPSVTVNISPHGALGCEQQQRLGLRFPT